MLEAHAEEGPVSEADLEAMNPDGLARRALTANDWKYKTGTLFFPFIRDGLQGTNAAVHGRSTCQSTRSWERRAAAFVQPRCHCLEGVMSVYIDTVKNAYGKLGLDKLALTLVERTVAGAQGHGLTAARWPESI